MTFQDGIEAAAREIEAADGGLFGGELLADLAKRVRALREPSNGSAVTVMSGLDLAFEQFREEYPRTPGRSHWTPARKAFEKAVARGRKGVDGVHWGVEDILAGTRAFAASGKEFQFIEAPAVFLNQDRFLTTYTPQGPNLNGPGGIAAIRAALMDH